MSPTLQAVIRVLIVDDHGPFRENLCLGIAQDPDFEVVGQAASAKDALEIIESSPPDIVLMDIRMPKMSGIVASHLLRSKYPDLKIILLSGFDYDQYVHAAVRAGIQGYILKDTPNENIRHSIKIVAGGGTVFDPIVARKTFSGIPVPRVVKADSSKPQSKIRSKYQDEDIKYSDSITDAPSPNEGRSLRDRLFGKHPNN